MTGLELLTSEMSRQYADARDTLASCEAAATAAALPITAGRRLVLLGMGGSHWVNRICEPHYRAAGIDATAQVLSEYMRAPLPGDPLLLLTSQSGNSGEGWSASCQGRDDRTIIGTDTAPRKPSFARGGLSAVRFRTAWKPGLWPRRACLPLLTIALACGHSCGRWARPLRSAGDRAVDPPLLRERPRAARSMRWQAQGNAVFRRGGFPAW